MDEIPQTLMDAVLYFADRANSIDFMRSIKWPDGKIKCPKCGGDAVSEVKNRPGLHTCNRAACRKQFSVKVGTIFEDSPLGLDKWFVAIWSLANCKNGCSSHELGRAIGVTQRTAWFMLHRIRKAMESDSFQKFDGEVESDESFIGGGGADKTPVQAIIHRDLECSEVRTYVVQQTDAETLVGNIMRNVERETAVYTDGETAASGLAPAFRHETVNHTAGEFVRGRVHSNSVENFFTLLKRAIKGTYVAVAPYHLARYCHEQGFRFNLRTLNDAGRFLNALRGVLGVLGKRLTYRELASVGDAGFMGIK